MQGIIIQYDTHGAISGKTRPNLMNINSRTNKLHFLGSIVHMEIFKIQWKKQLDTEVSQSAFVYNYRLRSREIMHLEPSVCKAVCLFICLCALSSLNHLTYDHWSKPLKQESRHHTATKGIISPCFAVDHYN